MFKKIICLIIIILSTNGVISSKQLREKGLLQIEYDAGTAYNEGVELYSQKDYLGAIDKFITSLELYKKIDTEANPKTDMIHQLYKNLSVLYYTTKQFEQAIKYYTIRREYDPHNHKIVLSLKSLYESIGNDEKALKILEDYDKEHDNELITKAINEISVEQENTITNEDKSRENGFNFRSTNWGMNIPEVKKSEELDVFQENDNMLIYKDKIINLGCYIYYIFTNNKLVRSRYTIIEEHSNENLYINDYKDIYDILVKKYGKPSKEEKIWLDKLYKDDYERWGFAISLGHLRYYSIWNTWDTDITLALYGDNYKISLVVEYTSIKYKDLEHKVQEQEEMDKF